MTGAGRTRDEASGAGVRVATSHDAEEVHRIYRPIVLETPISFELEPPSPDEVAQRIGRTLATHPWLVWDGGGGRLWGYAYASTVRPRPAYRWSAEVSAYVDAGARRSGVGRALYEALFRLLERQGFQSLYAGITLPNDASVGFHEALGFEPVGVFEAVGYKHGRWHDVGWWQRALGTRPREPHPPIPFAELDA